MASTSSPTAPSSVRESFRAAMAEVAGPVAIVTTHAGGRPAGTTVSAFASLSMEPPMLLMSLMRGSHLLSLLSVGADVGVNVLGQHQVGLARRFSARHEDRFAGVSWATVDGAPALDGAHAWVALRVARLVPAGDHVLVLGDVVNARSEPSFGAPTELAAPLTYHRRTFGTHRPH